MLWGCCRCNCCACFACARARRYRVARSLAAIGETVFFDGARVIVAFSSHPAIQCPTTVEFSIRGYGLLPCDVRRRRSSGNWCAFPFLSACRTTCEWGETFSGLLPVILVAPHSRYFSSFFLGLFRSLCLSSVAALGLGFRV